MSNDAELDAELSEFCRGMLDGIPDPAKRLSVQEQMVDIFKHVKAERRKDGFTPEQRAEMTEKFIRCIKPHPALAELLRNLDRKLGL